MINFRYIAQYADKRVDIAKRSLAHFDLNLEDWKDIKQQVLIHLFNKRVQLDSRFYKPWVKTVVNNKIKNLYRDKLAEKKRLPLISIISKVVQVDIAGNEEIIYEPDFPMPIHKNLSAVFEELDETSRIMINLRIEGMSWNQIGRVFNKNSGIYKIRDDIRIRILSML